MKVRKEVQEYPNKSLKYAVMDKSYNKSKAIGGFLVHFYTFTVLKMG